MFNYEKYICSSNRRIFTSCFSSDSMFLVDDAFFFTAICPFSTPLTLWIDTPVITLISTWNLTNCYFGLEADNRTGFHWSLKFDVLQDMFSLQAFGDIPSDYNPLSDALRLFDNFQPVEKLTLSIVKIKPTLLKRQFAGTIFYAFYA